MDGFLKDWDIVIHGTDETVLFAVEMLSVDWKYRVLPRQIGSKRHFAGLWLQKGILPAMKVATRRVVDSFSSASRSIFVALSFVFCLFLVRSSIGLR